MKALVVLIAACGTAVASLGASEAPVPSGQEPRFKSADQAELRRDCVKVVRSREESDPGTELFIRSVGLHVADDGHYDCLVAALRRQGDQSRHVDLEAQYSVTIDASTGKRITSVNRVDAEAAREEVVEWLSGWLMVPKTYIDAAAAEPAAEQIRFEAIVAGHGRCKVTANLGHWPEPQRWLVKSAACSKS